MKLRTRWIIILIVFVWAVIAVLPYGKTMKLGLDLQGGMHVILGVETDKAVEGRLDGYTVQLRKELAAESVNFGYIQTDNRGKINIALNNNADAPKVKKIIADRYVALEETASGQQNVLSYRMTSTSVNQIKEYAVEQSLEVVRNRIDQFGVTEPIIQRQGKDQVVVQLPGITDPESAINLIGRTAQLKFHIVNDSVNPEDALRGNLPFDSIILYQKDDGHGHGKLPLVLKREVSLTGDYIVDASVTYTQNGLPAVQFTLDAAGSKLFEELTGQNVNRRMAIVLDDNVYSAPVIRSRISGGSAIIDGMAGIQEATEIAIVLRAGSLPAPVKIEENRTVGPSLGQDSINAGFKAALFGILAVIVFIGIYYRLSGIVANLALLFNFLLIFAVMSQFQATLTLPGIAGLILTLAMSVDSNVLIYERIREELRNGRTSMNAIDLGYEKAFTTIIDANLTSIIAAVVLFQFGTGPIKGFAVTLSIGILVSLFTALFFTRTIFATVLGRGEAKSVSI
jgi:preprotein translocase subunit SecD